MTREQAINYLFSCGFTNEQVGEVVRALTYEPTTKNNLGVDCISRQGAIDAIRRIHPIDTDYDCTLFDKVDVMYVLNDIPSVTPQLSVPEVTALAEWTEKLTKECEEAYNKGYADGMKAQDKNCSDCEIVQACVEAGIRSTSKALSILDKIRAEITEYGSIWVEYKITGRSDKDIEQLVSDVLKQAKEQVLDVIDKYKTETEE